MNYYFQKASLRTGETILFSVHSPGGLTGYLIFLKSFIGFPFVENKRGFIIWNQRVTDDVTEICWAPATACGIGKRLLLFIAHV
jgi:hypothetical protein